MNREERLMRNIRLGKVKKGFTLVELLIVIIIIAVLAAIAIPKFANSSQRSKDSALRSNLKIVRDAVELFRADTGCYPAVLDGLVTVGTGTTGLKADGTTGCTYTLTDNRGPYLQSLPNDPTNNAAFDYTLAKVKSANAGNDANGIAYSTY